MTRRKPGMGLLTAALPLLLAMVFTGCSDSGITSVCAIGDRGPALSDLQSYLLVAGGLSEDWQALLLSDLPPTPLSERGLTGVAPNDIDTLEDRAFIVNSGDNTISVVRLSTGRTTGCIPTGTGTSPFEFTPDPWQPDRAWVTAFASGELLELDLNRLRVLRRVTVGPGAEGLLVGADRVQVTLTGFDADTFSYGQGQVVTYDKATLQEAARVTVPTNPQVLLAPVDGLIHVVCTGDYGFPAPGTFGKIVRLEPDGSAVRDTLEIGGSPARGEVAASGVAYLVSYFGGVLAYDTRTFQVVHGTDDPLLPEQGYTDVAVYGGILAAVNFETDTVATVALDSEHRFDDVPLDTDGPAAVAFWAHPIAVP